MARKTSVIGHGNKAFSAKKYLCLACGKDNPAGMHLKFSLDKERRHFLSQFRLSKRYTASPGYCPGGIVETIPSDASSKASTLGDLNAGSSRTMDEHVGVRR